MALAGLMALLAGLCCSLPQQASAQSANARTMLNGYNSAFLYTSGSTAVYKNSFSDSGWQSSWGLALDIEAEEDAYEVSGSAADQTLVNNLCASFLVNNWTNGWAGDGWNDDIGWMSLAMARGYQMTGNAQFLNAAEYGFNMAFARGWDATSNGGGILELQGTTGKNPLACNSLGKAAIIIYQCTGDINYYNKAKQIYDWVWGHLYDPSTGVVYGSINPDGTVNTDPHTYNQGTFADFANLLYESGAGASYLGDAQNAINEVVNHLTSGGILTDGGTSPYADNISRAIGHVCGYTPSLWSTYYPFMVNQCNAIWSHRRTDYNLTWNAWNQQTPNDSSQIPNSFVGAVSMMQFTPAVQPLTSIVGTHTVINKYSGLALDNPGNNLNSGTYIDQYAYLGGANDNWTFSQNSDGSYTIIDLGSGLALDDPGASTTLGVKVDEYTPNGTPAQKWIVTPLQDGCYKIVNKASGLALEDPNFSTANNTLLDQWSWNGGANQEWRLQNDPRAGTHIILNQANGLVIDNGSSTAQGAGMIQWGSNGGSAQKWTFSQNSDSSWTITSLYSGMVLDDPGSSTTNGKQMDQWGANGGSNQKWAVTQQSNGSYEISNESSGDALDDDSQTTNGTPLIQWSWNGGNNQLWKLQ